MGIGLRYSSSISYIGRRRMCIGMGWDGVSLAISCVVEFWRWRELGWDRGGGLWCLGEVILLDD